MARRVLHLELERDTAQGRADHNKVAAIKAALQFAIAMNEALHAFAPEIDDRGITDYNNGDEQADSILAGYATELLETLGIGSPSLATRQTKRDPPK